ncbi:MAG TPA: pyruvate carboxylase subunit B [Bacillota bacterium]|nr:pyruvate carboxylase subunit B [Bacillota bacterium]
MTRLALTDTTLRDAHQSLLATRMRLEDMLPIAEKLDAVGFHSLEVWGGATFDACLRFLGEDPWERLRALRAAMPRARLQMLLRGQNLVGYRHYPDDVVREFVRRSADNGIGVFRIFDALNDPRNLEVSMEAAAAAGAHVQATVCYTTSPLHDVDHFVDLARRFAAMGAHSLAIKDMAGLITPYIAHELVSRLKVELGLPVQFHSHDTTGLASMAYLKAAEAGADVVDTAISSLSGSTSQPPAESIVAALQGTPRDTGLDLELLSEIADYFRKVRQKYAAFDVGHQLDGRMLIYQMPGGMLSNFRSQLAEQKALDRLPEVLEEVPRVRADLGYPPLVTPSSQLVGAQAVLNVLAGERYKLVSQETRAYLKGQYGKPPGPVDPEVRRKVIGDEPAVTVRPADLLEPGLPEARRQAAPHLEQEEDVLSVAMFPQVALKFLEERTAARTRVDQTLAAEVAGVYPA